MQRESGIIAFPLLLVGKSDDPILPMVKITALYGLRRSELLGLQWDSVDFESVKPW